MRLLIGCHYLVASGGLLRFERVGSLLRHMGHEITFAVRSPYREFRSVHPVHSFEQAAAQEWDGVLIPGAGFPDNTIRAFEVFQAPQFGLRVQMIMSDQRILPRFRKVNAAFAPHMVIFNNEYWPSETYREFRASEFHHLIGAVDTSFYRPKLLSAQCGDRFVIGAQAAKNPEALLATLPLLPADCEIRFFWL